MPIYEVRHDSLAPVNATRFEIEKLSERGDIQRLLKDRIDCLEEGLMVLAEEFSDWQDSSRRIDLLCLDTDANLVVVELKRTSDGGHMELQAIRYAAMVSAMTFDQAVETYARSRPRNESGTVDYDAARAEILSFLNWDEPVEDDFAKDTRIILASADFSKELTTSVMWLRERDIDIRCVRLKPYKLEAGRVLMDIQQLIPLPEAAEFQTQIGAKRQAERKERGERHDLRSRFWEGLIGYARGHNAPGANLSPSEGNWISTSIGRGGFSLVYNIRKDGNSVYLWIYDNSRAYELLEAQREAIEADFGAPLIWEAKEGQAGRKISFDQSGGYRSSSEDWPNIHKQMVEAMTRLDRSLRNRLQQLPG